MKKHEQKHKSFILTKTKTSTAEVILAVIAGGAIGAVGGIFMFIF